MIQARNHLLVFALYAALFACWFSPALIGGKYLAPGDGTVEFMPDYLAHRTLWEPALATGFPAAADPQTFTWYLPAVLLSWIPGSYNAFVISGYVLAAWFTYLFVFTLTASRLAGWIAGILYGFSGFLMAYVGIPAIVDSAAWIPAVLLGLERIRSARSLGWFVFGCLATGQLVLSGHSQIVGYGLLFALVYALVRGYSTSGARSYYIRAALLLGFGIGLGAVLLAPLLELGGLSVRHDITFEFFNFARFPVRSLALLFFPNLYGADWGSIYGERFYLDITEGNAFLGFLTLALATFAFSRKRQTAPVHFLLGSALLALLCSFGGDTFVGKFLFHIPFFNLFRCQSRFLVIFQLAMAVLAGIGVKGLLSGLSAKRVAWQTGILLSIEIAAAFTISLVQGPALRQVAASRGVPNVSFAVRQPMFLVPLVCAAMAALAILLLVRPRSAAVSAVVLSLAAFADMGQFGLFEGWRYNSPSRNVLDPPPTAELLRSLGGRTVAVRGFLGNSAELPPNRSKLWGIESLNQYRALAVERYSSLTSMDSGGTLLGPRGKTGDRSLDILGARWILTPDADIGEMDRFQGIPMPAENLNEELGESAERRPETVANFAVDKDKRFTSLALVSFLRGSVQIPNGTPVLQLRIAAQSGRDTIIPVLAGRDTAGFLAGCSAAPSLMEHASATVFQTVTTETSGGTCTGRFYFAQWPVPAGEHWSSLDATWLPSQGGIEIVKLVLWNQDTGAIQAISPEDSLDGRFRLAARKQMARVYENRRAMPRVWIVSQALRLKADGVKQAIQTSILPDGSAFDPATTALLEDPAGLRVQAPDPGASAAVTRAENTLVEVRTKSHQPGILILADLYYPGWRATVNGRAARILRTNFVQRGVAVPAGDNVVRFTFHPASLYLGIGIALASIAGIALTCAMGAATAKPIVAADQP